MKQTKSLTEKEQIEAIDTLLNYFQDDIEFYFRSLTSIWIPLALALVGLIFSIQKLIIESSKTGFISNLDFIISIFLGILALILLITMLWMYFAVYKNKSELKHYYMIKERIIRYGKLPDSLFNKTFDEIELKILTKVKKGKRYLNI